MRKNEEERKEEMTKFINGKDPGKLAVNGRNTMLGVPREKISSKSGSISKEDNRGKGEVCFKAK